MKPDCRSGRSCLGGVWVEDFYSRTGHWWGEAEPGVGDRDRVERLHRVCGPEPGRLLEFGCGYGNTAAAFAEAGHRVVAVELSDRAGGAAWLREHHGYLAVLKPTA